MQLYFLDCLTLKEVCVHRLQNIQLSQTSIPTVYPEAIPTREFFHVPLEDNISK